MLGIVTDSTLPNLIEDDRLFADALARLDVASIPVVWDGTPISELPERLLLRTPWDYVDRLEEFLGWLDKVEASGRSLWNPAETVRWNVDKRYLLELERYGVPIVPTIAAEPLAFDAAVEKALTQFDARRVVVKPTVSSSAKGIVVAPNERGALQEAAREVSKMGALILQPFLETIATDGEISLIFTNFGQMEFSHAVAKVPKNGDFRVQMAHGGLYRREMPDTELFALSHQLLTVLPVEWLYARLDWVQWRTEPLLGEVEITEPHLYWHHAPEKAEQFAERLATKWPRPDQPSHAHPGA